MAIDTKISRKTDTLGCKVMFLQLYLFSCVSSIVTPNLRLYFIVSTIIINSSQASQGSIESRGILKFETVFCHFSSEQTLFLKRKNSGSTKTGLFHNLVSDYKIQLLFHNLM